jgi:NAD dependent epimerase/dehydratase family enzyme
MMSLLSGATGAIGKSLVPRLVAAGHEVLGMTRSESKQATTELRGASKAKAMRDLGWLPRHPSRRQRFAAA